MDGGRDIMKLIEARVKAARAIESQKQAKAEADRQRKRNLEQQRVDEAFASLRATRDRLKATVERMRTNVEAMQEKRAIIALQLESLLSLKRKAAASIDVAIGMVSGTVVNTDTIARDYSARPKQSEIEDALLRLPMSDSRKLSPETPSHDEWSCLGLCLPAAMRPSEAQMTAERVFRKTQNPIGPPIARCSESGENAGRQRSSVDAGHGNVLDIHESCSSAAIKVMRSLAASVDSSLQRHRVAVVDGFAVLSLQLSARRELMEALARGRSGQARTRPESEGQCSGTMNGQDMESLEGPFALHPGRVGGGSAGKDESYERSGTRGDWMAWLPPGSDGEESACTALQECAKRIDELVLLHLAPQCDALRGMTLYRKNAMAAVYPSNRSRYTRHVDNPNGNGRVITALLYLNPANVPGSCMGDEGDGGLWREELGGHLVVHPSMKDARDGEGYPSHAKGDGHGDGIVDGGGKRNCAGDGMRDADGDGDGIGDCDGDGMRGCFVGMPSDGISSSKRPRLFPVEGMGLSNVGKRRGILVDTHRIHHVLPRVLDLDRQHEAKRQPTQTFAAQGDTGLKPGGGRGGGGGGGGRQRGPEEQTRGEPAGHQHDIDIVPVGGRLVLFWSDRRCPHEVLPCEGQRAALSVWYVDGEERSDAEEAAAAKAEVSQGCGTRIGTAEATASTIRFS